MDLNQLLSSAIKWQDLFRNKYFIALVCFGVWMVFFDRHSLVTKYRLDNTLQTLEDEKASYEEEIAIYEDELLNFDDNIEKIAREKYFIQKKDEDVFIIVKEEN